MLWEFLAEGHITGTTQTVIDEGNIRAFIQRWKASGAAERANYQLFLTELCDLLSVPGPEPAGPDDALNAYVFDRSVLFQNNDGTTSTGFIDLYKRGSFVLEAKQGSEKDTADHILKPARMKKSGFGFAKEDATDLKSVAGKKGKAAKPAKTPWPKSLADRAKRVRTALAAAGKPVTSKEIAKAFKNANTEQVEELLDTLVSLGQAREVDKDKFVA
ncbi:MAG TPA: type IIL restriction-modification enzyme MmeI [Tepidisphaeraceae bacterium]|jgi:hypothetical protein|nr:type IIL restriction-modification enzyme MmeI [Tepidisphaeraceae bacterium]